MMDAARVQRVLYNLVQNAIRHTPADGTVLLEARGADAVRVAVVDSGEGVAPADLPHIFERFYGARSRGCGARGRRARPRHRAGARRGARRPIWAESARPGRPLQSLPKA